MLIQSPRHTVRDLEAWAERERVDAVLCTMTRAKRTAHEAAASIRVFAERGSGYAGTSWGKDSTVIAHMVATKAPQLPLVWIRVTPLENPDCASVRDAFVSAYPAINYHEIAVEAPRASDGNWLPTGRLEEGFALAASRFGARYISGVRADESGKRRLRMMRHGVASENACAPIGWWTGDDVFAYLYAHNLPVHPAYAMSFGGMLDRNRIRVASIGGERGTGHGRREWEERYYP